MWGRYTGFGLWVSLSAAMLLPDAALAQDGSAGLEEIVVTARKREESLQDTPVSITAFTGESLERRQVHQLDQIAASTPNLTFNSGTSFSGISSAAGVYIRGIGQLDFTLTTEPGVGIYLDGAYIATSIGGALDLVDVERIEVLRGPQGTLFGRNTIGGAISVTSKKPDDPFHGRVKVTTGAYDRVDFQGSVNIPVTDTLYALVSAGTFNRDGFLSAPNTPDGDDLGNIDKDMGRIALRFVPNDRFTADFSADYTHHRENGVPAIPVGSYAGASLAHIGNLANPASPDFVPPPLPLPAPSFLDLHNLLAVAPIGEQGGIAGLTPGVVPSRVFGQPTLGPADVQDVDGGNLRNLSNEDLSSGSDVWGVALSLEYDLDLVRVKSITSYRDMEADTRFDADALPVTITMGVNSYETRQVSEEIQLSGTAVDDRLNWLLGFYYFNDEGTNLDQTEFTPIHVLSGAKVDNESVAGFGQFTFDVTEQLSLTAGMRYTWEDKAFIVPSDCYELPGGPVTLADGTVVTCAQLQSMIEPKLVNAGFLNFANSPVFPAPGGRFCCLPVSDAQGNIVGLLPGLNPGDQMLARGTTSRSFSDWTPHADIAYRWTPDFMTYFTYSEGFKSGGFVQRVFPPRTGVPSFSPETATVYEVGFKWNGLDDRLRVNAAGFHTDYDDLQILVNDGIAPVMRNAAAADIDGFELELTAAPAPAWLIQAGVGYIDAGYTRLEPDENYITDLFVLSEDTRLPNTPKWSTSLGLQHTWEVPRFGGQLISRLDWSYRSKVWLDALNFPELAQPGYHLLDLSVTYVSADGRWELSAFGRNVTDERYLVTGFANALTQGYVTANLGRPAEWGLSVGYNFGN